VGTGKWLRGNTYTADREHDCLRLSLSEGDENCHFRVMPRFRIRREGSVAYFGDMLHLRSEKIPGYSIRVTDKPCDQHEPLPHVHELNLSLVPSALKVTKFYRPASKDLTLINTNVDFVRFFHAETNRFLQGSCETRKVGEKDDFIDEVRATGNLKVNDDVANSRRRSTSFFRMSSNNPAQSAAESAEFDDNDNSEYLNLGTPSETLSSSAASNGDQEDYCPFFTNLTHKQPSNPLNLSAKSMFIFEYQTRLISGFVRWNSPVRIKHVGSGRYLAVESQHDPSLSASKRIHRCYLANLTESDALTTSLFHIVPTDQQGEFIPEAHVSMRIEHRIAVNASSTLTLHATNLRVKGGLMGAQGKDFGLFFSEKKNAHDAMIMMPLEKSSSFDRSMKLALAMKNTLEWFSSRVMTRQPIKFEHIRRIESVLAKLIYFSDKYFSPTDFDRKEGSKNYNPIDALSTKHEVSKSFQLLAKDSKLLDKVFKVAVVPTTVPSITMDYNTKTQRFVNKTFRHLEAVVKLAWKALEYIILDNRVNENYFASHRNWINPGIVVQMPYPIGAATAFASLITNNTSLLESVIDSSMLLAFEDLIIQNGPHPRLMSFFTAICSCLGKPILSNQETILHHLIMDKERHSKILLNVYEDDSSVPQPWKFHGGSDMNPNPLPQPDKYLGQEEVVRGWNTIIVSWENLATMENFFINGRQFCDIGEFCAPLVELEQSRSRSRARSRSSSKVLPPSPGTNYQEHRHLELVQYLSAQIELFSTMCLGRSYNCIHVMQKMFPYALLCNLLTQQEALPNDMKRAFTDLLRCLWVDRYPHAPLNLPRRYWVAEDLQERDIRSDGSLACFELSETHQLRNNSDPFYSFATSSKFFILVDLIIRYFERLGGEQVVGKTSENTLTTSMLDLTHDLMSFGFFGSEGEIHRLLDCIVACLDGRNDSLDVTVAKSSTRLSVGTEKRRGAANASFLRELKTESVKYGKSSKQFINGIMSRKEYGNLRYQEDSSSIQVMACKSNIIKVLLVVEQLRANYRLSQLLARMKARAIADGINKTEAMSDLVLTTLNSKVLINALNAEEASKSPLDTVLLDLMMYASDELYEQAFVFMQNRYTDIALMMRFLPTITILEDSRIPIFEDYSCLLESLHQLKYYFMSYEVWAVRSIASPMNLRSYNHTCYLLHKLLSFIYAPSYNKRAFGDKVKTKEERIARIEKYCIAERKAITKETERASQRFLGGKAGAGVKGKCRITKRNDR